MFLPCDHQEFTAARRQAWNAWEAWARLSADQNVNLLAFQSFPSEKGKIRFISFWDNHNTAQAFSINNSADYTETDVAHLKAGGTVPGSLLRPHRVWATRESTSTTCYWRDRGGDEIFDPDLRRRGGREGREVPLSWLAAASAAAT